MILCPGQGLLGQTSHQVAEQIRLLMKCKFFIEKDSGEKEMAMQVILTSRISHVNMCYLSNRWMKLQKASK